MSKHRIDRVICPKCSCKQEIIIWESVNSSENPELIKEILTGEIFKFTCHDCGAEIFVGYDFLYNNPDEKYMIYYVHDDKGTEKAIKLFNNLKAGKTDAEAGAVSKDYKLRIVKSLADLVEKITIFSSGLDDRIITAMKPFYLNEYEKKNGQRPISIYFSISDNNKNIFILCNEKKEISSLSMNIKLYDTIKEKFFDLVENADSFIIDYEWAESLLSQEL